MGPWILSTLPRVKGTFFEENPRVSLTRRRLQTQQRMQSSVRVASFAPLRRLVEMTSIPLHITPVEYQTLLLVICNLRIENRMLIYLC